MQDPLTYAHCNACLSRVDLADVRYRPGLRTLVCPVCASCIQIQVDGPPIPWEHWPHSGLLKSFFATIRSMATAPQQFFSHISTADCYKNMFVFFCLLVFFHGGLQKSVTLARLMLDGVPPHREIFVPLAGFFIMLAAMAVADYFKRSHNFVNIFIALLALYIFGYFSVITHTLTVLFTALLCMGGAAVFVISLRLPLRYIARRDADAISLMQVIVYSMTGTLLYPLPLAGPCLALVATICLVALSLRYTYKIDWVTTALVTTFSGMFLAVIATGGKYLLANVIYLMSAL